MESKDRTKSYASDFSKIQDNDCGVSKNEDGRKRRKSLKVERDREDFNKTLF